MNFGARRCWEEVIGRQAVGALALAVTMASFNPEMLHWFLLFVPVLAASMLHTWVMAPYPRYRITEDALELYRFTSTPERHPWADLSEPVVPNVASIDIRRGDGWLTLRPWQLEPEEREALFLAIRARLRAERAGR